MAWAILNNRRFDATRAASSPVSGRQLHSARNNPMPHFFLFLTIVAYVFSLGSYSRYLRAGKEISGRLGTVFLVLGLIAHYFALLERSRGSHTVPYHDLNGSLSLFGWLLALTYLGLELFHRQRSVGAFVMPFVLAFFLAANLTEGDKLLSAARPRPSLRLSRHAEHPRLRRFRALVRSEPDLPRRKQSPPHSQSHRIRLAPPAARTTRAHEPLQRPRRHRLHRHRHRPRLHLGRSSHGPIFRSKIRRHASRRFALRRVLASFTHDSLARRPRFASLYFQFCGRRIQFHRRELILVAQSSLLLASAVHGRNTLNFWPPRSAPSANGQERIARAAKWKSSSSA